MLAVIIPTIPGREESLARTIASYRLPDSDIGIYPNSPSSGAGWLRGTEEFVKRHGEPDYLALTNDDCELIGDLEAAKEVCDAGLLPAPIVYNPDDSLQSAGGMIGAPGNLLQSIGPDRSPVGFTTVPFMSWEQWKQIGMLEVHYASDVWVSYRGRQLGIETGLCHGYQVRHHNHHVGRGAGMEQNARDAQDRAIVEQALDA